MAVNTRDVIFSFFFSEFNVFMTSLPYLPFTLEEVACIKSLNNWTNCKARVVGRAQGVDPGTGRGRLGSVGEGVLSIIRICLRAIPDKIEAVSRGQIVMLLGQLEMFRGDPILRDG